MSNQIEDKMLSLYPIDYPFETLVNRINARPAKLKLDPDFQRKYKWDNDGWVRSSKFIESCLMRIPLPSCYFAEDDDGNHMVIDGLQRLTTINRFFNDEFALEGLTKFKELEGLKFSEIGQFQTELETTTIRCIVLRKDNPKSLIREIFSRLNQGAVELSDQEIRHAIYPGSLDMLLAELASAPAISRFGMAENNENEKDGLEPEEQVLRFFAFSDDKNLEKFTSNLKGFLDDYMEANSELDDEKISEHRERFNKALSICEGVFGEDAFVNPTVAKKRKGLVHYDLVMTTVGELSEDIANQKATAIREAYATLCESEEFKRTLAGGLQDKSRIVRRRNKWSELLKAVVDA
ncbi:Protein of unknown function DUF262 [Geoalkalibacter ferrihydriticus]|uniref:GmrSD restriction endonucleases N-terminal domain-containing protein n=2 Tax=Geoalkalibacter ferrihydriticus TaxID=392333 RepID=A0A0C2DV56_9BACT|nr:DUF262 domain-containing protein [Geoalkalibacter ferrihydriticus]KIH77309.1 hypothetical protein GFER_00690 [Geoalkalibacter ferrihydriticus DSM 17813]SDM20463.1 Protein of unknown function DUF262 [Geoalkalibacter ferrihydriticus]